MSLATRTGSLKRTIVDFLARELVERTIPDKPKSRLQKYRLTQKGRQLLQQIQGEAL